MEISNTHKHPCFSTAHGHGQYGRIHLPVAPKCNLQCRYCNRKFDCANESRPGVTSAVLSPKQAMSYLSQSLEINPNITVAAIAGPGDAFANADETLETLRLLREEHPSLIACLSTNGLNLKPHIREVFNMGVRYITMTINGFKPEVVSQVYQWIRYDKRTYRGIEAAEILIAQQMEALELAKSLGMTVKVNSVILPGINDQHLPELAQLLSVFGVDRMNCIPVQQNENDFFEHMIPPTEEQVAQVRDSVAPFLPVMTHCKRCRSDAAGYLDEDQGPYQKILKNVIQQPNRNRVAVTSNEGLLINAHLGEAEEFMIFEKNGDEFRFCESRTAPPRGLGDGRWEAVAEVLSDCSNLLVAGIGPNPLNILRNSGLVVDEVMGFIDENLEELAKGTLQNRPKNRKAVGCGDSCSGSGTGCCS